MKTPIMINIFLPVVAFTLLIFASAQNTHADPITYNLMYDNSDIQGLYSVLGDHDWDKLDGKNSYILNWVAPESTIISAEFWIWYSRNGGEGTGLDDTINLEVNNIFDSDILLWASDPYDGERRFTLSENVLSTIVPGDIGVSMTSAEGWDAPLSFRFGLDLVVETVPEPNSVVLLAVGAGILYIRRKKSNQRVDPIRHTAR